MLLSSSDEEMLSRMRTLQVDITEDSTTPTKGTEGSAAYDLQCHRNTVIPAHGITTVPLNIHMAIPSDYFLLISCSGLAKKGVLTLAGVIDSDYRGPVCLFCFLWIRRHNAGKKITRYFRAQIQDMAEKYNFSDYV